MKAVFFPGDSKTVVKDVPMASPGPKQVLIEMRAAGMCGSDLHHLYHVPKEERARPFLGINVSPDIIPGHEPAGTVAEIGSSVQSLKEGDRVVVHHISGCSHCKYCLSGHVIHCERSIDRRTGKAVFQW